LSLSAAIDDADDASGWDLGNVGVVISLE